MVYAANSWYEMIPVYYSNINDIYYFPCSNVGLFKYKVKWTTGGAEKSCFLFLFMNMASKPALQYEV